MGAAHLGSAFAHLANPRQWSRAPTCNLKGSGAESGSRGYCGLKPSRGLIICGLMINMELPGRCMLFAALVMSVPHPACSGQCFMHVNYSPARAIKISWLAKHAWCLSDELIDMERWGWFEYAKQTKLCMRIHTQQDLAESSQFAFRLMHAKSAFNLSVWCILF